MNIKLCLITLLILFSFPNHASDMYVSHDIYGNKVYSDVPPAVGDFETVSANEIPTIKWQSRRLKFNLKTTSRKEETDNKKVDCVKLKSLIEQKQNSLRSRLKPEEFNQIKSTLSNTRWQYRKQCL